MSFKNQKIDTKRLRIVLQSDEDIEAFAESTENIELIRLSEAILNNCRSNPKQRKWSAFWKVYTKDTNVEIGCVRFLGEPSMGSVELVHEIKKEFFGNGFVTETIDAMTNWAFNQDKVYIVYEETSDNDSRLTNGLKLIGYVECGEGLEGIRYRKVKPQERALMIFSCIGLLIGLLFGSVIGRLLYGIGIGFGLGVIAGAVMQMIDYRTRDKTCGEDAELNTEDCEIEV